MGAERNVVCGGDQAYRSRTCSILSHSMTGSAPLGGVCPLFDSSVRVWRMKVVALATLTSSTSMP